MPTRRPIVPTAVAALLLAALLLAACSGGGDDAAPTTVPSTVPTTSIAPVAEPLFGSIGGFVAAYTAVGGSGATQGTEFDLTEDALTTGPIDNDAGDTGFISVEAIPSGVIGGAADADGAVTALFVFVDPLTGSAAPAVLSLLGSMVATPARFDEAVFAQEYRSLAIEAAVRADDQIWYPSTNDSGHSVVVTVVAGAAGSNNLVEVAIVPIADEEAAKAAVKPLRNAVFSLVA